MEQAALPTGSSSNSAASFPSTGAGTTMLNENGKRPLSSQATMATTTKNGSSGTSGGGTKVLPRTDKNGAPLSEKKLRRLEKNRLSARECRRRKREATENMQRQINLLEGENLRLRLQLQVGEEAEESSQQEQQKLVVALDELLKSGGSESEVYAKIEEYKEKYADYGRDRRSAIEFHLRNIERLLMPTQTTSLVLTTLNMSSGSAGRSSSDVETASASNATIGLDELAVERSGSRAVDATGTSGGHPTTSTPPAPITGSSSSATSSISKPTPPSLTPKSLFRHLVQILEVTPEQAAALKDSRFVAQEMDECLTTSLRVLKELRDRLNQCGEDLENEFDNVRRILTPTQAAKFLVWVANNKACMHMLNELWNRVYPQGHERGTGNNTPTGGEDDVARSNENSPTSQRQQAAQQQAKEASSVSMP